MVRQLGRALAVLLLLPCFALAYDGVLLVTSWQRLDRAASGLADAVAAAGHEGWHEADFTAWFAAGRAAAAPDDVAREGTMIVTAIETEAGGGALRWQRRGGSALVPSAFETEAALGAPSVVAVARSGTVIAAEVVAPLSPWVIGAGLLRGVFPDGLRVQALRAAR